MKAKVARRYQITIPEDVREEVGISVGDIVEVSSSEGRVVIEKVGRDWNRVMKETRGSWKSHPAFSGLKDAVEVTNWLRNKRTRK